MDATEKEIKALERKIASVYADAQEEVSKKWSAYLERMDKKNAPLWDALGKAENKDEENRIMSQIQANMRKQTLNDNHYKSLVNDISARLANASVIASDYVNGRLPNIYSLNYNDLFKQSELLETGVSFELIDEATVRHLMTTDKSILPTKKVDVPKATAWNVKQINNQVTQGIIQGENVQKIAKRLQTVTDMNRASSVRNARTMCTEAQNKGRLDSFKEAENEGLIVKKVWMATSDDRTRDWHALLNGEERDVDEPFQTEYGDIMYPGDPTAEPCNVYNCRCTLVSRIVGFKKTTQTEEEEQNVVKDTPIVEATPQERMSDLLYDNYLQHVKDNDLTLSVDEDVKPLFKANFNKISEEAQNDFTNTLSGLMKEYDSSLQEVRIMSKEEYLTNGKALAFSYHNYDVDKSTLVINPVSFKDGADYKAKMRELSDNGYAVKVAVGKEGEYIATHEFAHTLIDTGSSLDSKRNFANADYSLIKQARKEITETYNEYAKSYAEAEHAFKVLEEKALTTFDNADWEKAQKAHEVLERACISRYSLTNADEFMAEAFTASRIGAEPVTNEHAQKVVKIIDKYFKR